MVEPRRRRALWIVGLSLLAGAMHGLACGPPGSGAASGRKVVVIRLGGQAAELEPIDADLEDGLRQGGMKRGSDYTLLTVDAEGNLGRVAGLVDEAVEGGADLLIALHAETAPIVVDHAGKVPVVFFVSGDPVALGLGASVEEHRPGVTGAFLPFGRDDLMLAAAGCLPKVERFGIAYNPDDRASKAHKDVLVAATPGGIRVETAEFRQESQAVEAAKSLLSGGVDALILVTGMGDAAPAVIEEASKAKVPCFGFTPGQARAGAVLTRTPDARWGGFEAGRRAARVLGGEDAGRTPFIMGPSYNMFINNDSVKELQIKIPGDLLREPPTWVGTGPNP